MGWCFVLPHTEWHSPAVGVRGTFDACPSKKFLLQSSHTRNTSDKILCGPLHKTPLPSQCCINFSTPHVCKMLIAVDLQCGIVTKKQSLPGSCLPTPCAGKCCRCIQFCRLWTFPTVTEVCMTLLVFYNNVSHYLLRDLQVFYLHTYVVDFLGPLKNFPTRVTVALDIDVRHWLE